MGDDSSQRARERELREELEAHLAIDAAERQAAGATEEQAASAARRELGNLLQVEEATRATWWGTAWSAFWRDLLHGVRTLARNPSFALLATGILALGIGACAAVFSLVDGFLLRPLPYDDPDELVFVWETIPERGAGTNSVSPANFLDWRDQAQSFTELGTFVDGPVAVSGDGAPTEYAMREASAGLLTVLRVKPWRGRLLTAEDDRPGTPPVVMISYRMWRQRYGAEETIVGQSIRVDGETSEVVGVLPPGFYLVDREVDLWGPIGLDPAQNYRAIAGHSLTVVGRLKPGVSRADAHAEMTTIAARLESEYPDYNEGWGANVVGMREELVRDARSSLLALMGGAVFLLLIACTNVANLLLTRATVREQEMAVRGSLGANRWRLGLQVLTESLALAVTGGGLGVAVAALLVEGFVALAPQISGPFAVSLDGRILAFAVAISLATVLLASLAPALGLARTEANVVRAGHKSTGRGAERTRSLLVGAQVAVTVLLLIGSGLLMRSFVRLQAEDPGMRTDHLLTARVSLPSGTYSREQGTEFFRDVRQRIAALPGVRNVSAVSFLPYTRLSASTYVRFEGAAPQAQFDQPLAHIKAVLPDYFVTAGIPVLEGRALGDEDNRREMPLRYVVNQEFVDRYAEGDPFGRRIRVFMQDENPFGEIVGVVGNQRRSTLSGDVEPTVYFPQGKLAYRSMQLMIHTAGDPESLVEPVRAAVLEVDPNQPIAAVRSMEAVLDETMVRERILAWLSALFGGLSLLLAMVGVYGTLSYSVRQSRRELGVRMALGAQTMDVFRRIAGAGMRVVAAGVVLGALGAAGLTGYLESLLYEVEPYDAVSYWGAVALLLFTAALAVAVPAWTAARVEPAVALRYE